MLRAFLLTLMLYSGFSFQALAQEEDLTQDAVFFRKQMTVYQRWLNHSGIGDYLSVRDVTVQPQKLTLYLEFPFTAIDSVASAWSKLRVNHSVWSSMSLEEHLLYKASFIMEVDKTDLVLEVRNTYAPGKKAFFERELSYSGGIQVEESNPKSKTETISLTPADMSKMRTESVAQFQERYRRSVVYDCILEYVQERFEQDKCINRFPKVRVLENGKHLEFEVTDLCREVLVDETNPILCRIMRQFGRGCNWVKREMLRFHIVHENTDDGFSLKIVLDGKYGSGFYDKVKRGGYLDMEVDFDEYLEDYIDAFKIELKNTFVNCNQ